MSQSKFHDSGYKELFSYPEIVLYNGNRRWQVPMKDLVERLNQEDKDSKH